jgi:hypothetical protein
VSLRVFDGWSPTETHEHRDAAGNLTGTTIVTREPEFDDRLRAEYLALVGYEDRCCKTCGNFNTIIEDPSARRHVTWDEHGGRVMDVHHFLCLACGASQLIERDFTERHSKNKPAPGQAAPSDGRMIVAAPLSLDG